MADVIKDWQCGKPLVECLEYMYTSGTATDVTFVVGEARERLHAHKSILISRSPVFYAMLEGPMSEKGEIVIPDIEKEHLNILLRYLYTDKYKLSNSSATGVLSAARKYCVDILVTECTKYLDGALTPANACSLLEESHRYHEDDLKTKCLKIINKNHSKCMKSEGFTDLCGVCVTNITSSDDLGVNEDQVYEAVLRWSEAECQRQEVDVTDANRRKVLGNILYTVRFPIMDPNYITNRVIRFDILSHEEMVAILRYQQNITQNDALPFPVSERSGRSRTEATDIKRITRLLQKIHGSWALHGSPDAISFSSTEPVRLHGIGIYGGTLGSSGYTPRLQVYDNADVCLCDTIRMINTDSSVTTYDLRLDTPIDVQPGVTYTIVLTMRGMDSYNGINGLIHVNTGDTTITFMDSERSINRTNIHKGQIPYIILSRHEM